MKPFESWWESSGHKDQIEFAILFLYSYYSLEPNYTIEPFEEDYHNASTQRAL